MSNINVTPLVDVMLVLLIVFMITAPMLTVGVQVDLPKTKANQLNSDADPLIITMKKIVIFTFKMQLLITKMLFQDLKQFQKLISKHEYLLEEITFCRMERLYL